MTDIRPDSRHWWHHDEHFAPKPGLGAAAPPPGRHPDQLTRFQGFQRMIFDTLEDARGELSAEDYQDLLSVVGVRSRLLREKL